MAFKPKGTIISISSCEKGPIQDDISSVPHGNFQVEKGLQWHNIFIWAVSTLYPIKIAKTANITQNCI